MNSGLTVVGSPVRKVRPSSDVPGWMNMLKNKHAPTYTHCIRVAKLAHMLGTAMRLTEKELAQLGTGCCLHDIGKLMIPNSILNSAKPMTDREWRLMKLHPEIGSDILERTTSADREVIEIVRHHHERWDGTGYPAGLKGADIPLFARICSVVDAFDSMISERPYRKRRTIEEAVTELIAHGGTQFDTAIVLQFEAIVKDVQYLYPIKIQANESSRTRHEERADTQG